MLFRDPFLQITLSLEAILAFKHNFITYGSLPTINSLKVLAFEFYKHGTLLFKVFGNSLFYLVCGYTQALIPLFYCYIMFQYKNNPQCTYFFSPVLEHSDCFQFFAVVNNISLTVSNMSLQEVAKIMYTKQLNQWVYGCSALQEINKCMLQSGDTILYSHYMRGSVSSYRILPALGNVRFL